MINKTQAALLKAASEKEVSVLNFLVQHVNTLKAQGLVVAREKRGKFLSVIPVAVTLIQTTPQGRTALTTFERKNKTKESPLGSIGALIDTLLLLF